MCDYQGHVHCVSGAICKLSFGTIAIYTLLLVPYSSLKVSSNLAVVAVVTAFVFSLQPTAMQAISDVPLPWVLQHTSHESLVALRQKYRKH